MKVLVTGAGGYVGGHLLRYLAATRHDLYATYRHDEPFLPSAISSQVEMVKVDLGSSVAGLASVDVVIHAATVHPHSRKVPDAVDYLESNVTATKNVADFAVSCSARILIYLSTVAIHGRVEVGELKEDTPQIEPDLLGATKFLSEQVLESYSDDLPTVVLRLPGVVGPDILGLGRPWLSTVLHRALSNQSISLYCGDSPFNNLIDVDELSRLAIDLIDRWEAGFDVFNVAAACPMPLIDVVHHILELADSCSEILQDPSTRSSYFINTDKLIDGYGFTPDSTSAITERFVAGNLT